MFLDCTVTRSVILVDDDNGQWTTEAVPSIWTSTLMAQCSFRIEPIGNIEWL